MKQMQYYAAITLIAAELPGEKSTKYDYGNKFFLSEWPEISSRSKYSRKCLDIQDILGQLAWAKKAE